MVHKLCLTSLELQRSVNAEFDELRIGPVEVLKFHDLHSHQNSVQPHVRMRDAIASHTWTEGCPIDDCPHILALGLHNSNRIQQVIYSAGNIYAARAKLGHMDTICGCTIVARHTSCSAHCDGSGFASLHAGSNAVPPM